MISPRKSKRWNWVITPHPTATSSPVHLSLCPYLSSSLQFLWATVLWSLSLSVSQGLPWLSSSFSSIINSSLSMESKHASISTPFMKISLGSALPFSHGSIPPLSSEQHSLQELSVLALSSFTSVLFIPSYVAFLSTPPLKWHLARPLIANKVPDSMVLHQHLSSSQKHLTKTTPLPFLRHLLLASIIPLSWFSF